MTRTNKFLFIGLIVLFFGVAIFFMLRDGVVRKIDLAFESLSYVDIKDARVQSWLSDVGSTLETEGEPFAVGLYGDKVYFYHEMGVKGSGGYSVWFTKIAQKDDEIHVYTDYEEPQGMATMVMSIPSAVGSMDNKSGIVNEDTTFVLHYGEDGEETLSVKPVVID